jgi:replication initiation factor
MAQKTPDKNNPPALTGGSGNKILSQKLHWIEGTFKSGNAVSVPSSLPSKFVECHAFKSYKVGKLYEDGRILLTHPNRPEMGEHLIWQGQACDACPVDHIELLNHLQEAGFSFTQLDMAIDAINFNLRPQQATEELAHDRCKTRAKKSPRRDDPRDPGYTQYVGKKTSEIFLKLYDKAEEMGVVADHCRVELTVRQARADKAAWQIIHGTDFRSMVVAFADFPAWREWKEVMDAIPVKLPSQRHETNTERWLLEQCAPALARVIYFASNTAFYERFKEKVMIDLEQLSNGIRTVH